MGFNSKMLHAAGLLALALLLAACRPTPQAPAEPHEALYFEPIGAGYRATLADSGAVERAVRDADAWNAYADSLRPQQPFAPVDFAQTMVLFAAVPQTTSGITVAFRSVEAGPDGVVATYVLHTPGTDCLTAAALTVPFAAVVVPQTDGPVRFVRLRDEYDCTVGIRR